MTSPLQLRQNTVLKCVAGERVVRPACPTCETVCFVDAVCISVVQSCRVQPGLSRTRVRRARVRAEVARAPAEARGQPRAMITNVPDQSLGDAAYEAALDAVVLSVQLGDGALPALLQAALPHLNWFLVGGLPALPVEEFNLLLASAATSPIAWGRALGRTDSMFR